MNASLVLALLAAVVSVRAYRRRATAATNPAAALAAAGVAYLIAAIAVRAAASLAPSAGAEALGLMAALASLPLWDALVRLALHDVRGRAWLVNAAMAALAVFAFQGGGSLFLPVMFANLALARWRGPRSQPAGDRWAISEVRWAVPGATAVVVIQLALWLTARSGAAPGPALRFAQWTCVVAALQAAQELPGMVRQAALSVRRVRRRLTLLFVLAAFVPLVLTGTLWALTTWLGVGSEDALIAARALREEAATLDRSLAAAHQSEAALAAYARHWETSWPDGELWLRTRARPSVGSVQAPDAWRRLAGPVSAAPREFESWSASDSVRLAVIGGHASLVATHVSADDSSLAVALVPAKPLLEARISRVVGVRLRLETEFPSLRDSSGEAMSARDLTNQRETSPPDTRRDAAGDQGRRQPRWVITGRGDSAQVVEAATPRGGLFNGRAVIPARVWIRGQWMGRFALLAAENDARRIFFGLYRDVRENPFAIIPLAVLAFVFSVFVFVLIFDFRMVRDLGRSVAGAVATLREGTAALERGDLSHRIEVRGRDDLWEVAEAFNRMSTGLERGREHEVERRRIEGELALARRIQARLLPGPPPEVAGLEIAGVSESAREVGGDYFDHFLLADGRLLLAVADVSGKGVPAALLMSAVRAGLITQPSEGERPADVLRRIHLFLYRSVEPGQFVTAFLAFLDASSGHLEYCNAGHNPPIVVSPDGALSRLECGGLVLGIVEDASYETGEMTLAPGALLAIFTDGVTEAQNPAGELWGEDALIELLRALRSEPPRRLASRLLESVRAFESGRPASDDVTLLLVRRR